MSHPLFNLQGKRSLITGSSQGIGLALAQGLSEAGAEIILNGRTQSKLDEAAKKFAQGAIVKTSAFDVTDPDAAQEAVDGIEAEHGPIDILVNNAGIQIRDRLDEFPVDEWRRIMATNLDSLFYVAKPVASHMLKRKAGKIINTCSVMSLLGRPTTAPYAATKGAAAMLTKAMCVDWAPHDIQVNGIAPGYFATELTDSLVKDKEFTGWLEKRTPAGRWGRVEELQGACIFLASDASSFVNGHILYVDGGMTAAV